MDMRHTELGMRVNVVAGWLGLLSEVGGGQEWGKSGNWERPRVEWED